MKRHFHDPSTTYGWLRQIRDHLMENHLIKAYNKVEYMMAHMEKWAPTHRHKKRGTTYKVLGSAEIQTAQGLSDGEAAVVYQDEEGKLWCRALGEFKDGRFEELAHE